jgi:hypothetical protein
MARQRGNATAKVEEWRSIDLANLPLANALHLHQHHLPALQHAVTFDVVAPREACRESPDRLGLAPCCSRQTSRAKIVTDSVEETPGRSVTLGHDPLRDRP